MKQSTELHRQFEGNNFVVLFAFRSQVTVQNSVLPKIDSFLESDYTGHLPRLDQFALVESY